MLTSLNQSIHLQTDQLSTTQRVLKSLRAIHKYYGIPSAASAGLVASIGLIYLTAASYFCMEGSVRSLIDIHERNYSYGIVGLRPLGDVGGWVMLPLFSLLTIGNVALKILKEGELLRLEPLCSRWLSENEETFLETSKFREELYDHLNLLFDCFNSNCLVGVPLLERRLISIAICSKSSLADRGRQHIENKELVPILEKITTKIAKKLSYKGCLKIGLQSLSQGSNLEKLGALTLGIALPIIFLGLIVLTYIGEVALGVEIFYERQELTDIGHFGEWPLNAFEALSAMLILHTWCVINEGKFAIVKKVYNKYLNTMQNDITSHNALCILANTDLSERAAQCQYRKLPGDYYFEEI